MANDRGKQIAAEWKADGMENWMSHWQDVALLEHPLESWINNEKTDGQELRNGVINNIGEEALGTFTDGFVGSTMPKTEQWAEFEPVSLKDEASGRETPPSPNTKKAWQKASDRFIRLLSESNFYEAIHETVKDGGAFGSGCPGVFQGISSRLNFTNVAPGGFRFDEDEESRPDTIRRHFKYTAAQIASMFDRRADSGMGDYVDKLPEKIRKIIESGSPEDRQVKHVVIERISKNKDAKLEESGTATWDKRPFIGEYVLEGTQEHFFTEGYYERPWAIWRLEKSSQEKYGRGLGMKALPTLRKLQKMEKEYLRMLEKANDPGWLVHADSDFQEDGRAGALNIGDWDRADMKPELLQLTGGYRDLEARIEKEENKVRTIHFNDIFKLFLRDDIASKELKAAQVDAMMDEKLPLLVGIANRFLNECLKPLLRRAFMILWRSGAFDDLKQEMGNVSTFRITFRSRIAMAVKTLESRGILQVLNSIALAAQFDPMASLKIDVAGMLGRLAENSTAPSEFVRTEDEYTALRDAEQKKMEMAQAAAMAKDIGSAAGGLQ